MTTSCPARFSCTSRQEPWTASVRDRQDGRPGSDNSWPSQLIDSVLDVVRKEAEGFDCLQGLQLYHFSGTGGASDLEDP